MISEMVTTMRFDLGLLGALSPIEKWSALQRDSSGGGGWLIWALAVVAAAIVAAVVVAVVKHLLVKRSENEFGELCEKMELNPEEVSLLGQIVKLSGLVKGAGIFFSSSAFGAGVEKLMYSGQVGALSQEDRGAFCGRIGSIQDKLKFSGEGKSRSGLTSSRNIPEGSELSVRQRSGEKGIKARLVASNQIEFTIESIEAVPARQGIPCLIHYVEKGKSWEFDCVVAQSNQEKTRITLVHTKQGRLLNKRRFPRIPTIKSARVALFPFAEEAEAREQDLEFTEATLIEIAGPGLKLRSKLRVEVGQKVLVIVEGEEKTLKSLAIVRRRLPGTEEQGIFEMAVELLSLDAAEINVLLRETNKAQRELKNKSAGESSEALETVSSS